MHKQKQWGGKRTNSGRKKKVPSSYISFRVTIQEKENIYLLYGKSIHQMFKEWLKLILLNEKN
jgi:hypothetical protein